MISISISISLLPLVSINDRQLEQLEEIARDIEVMKWVGNGKLWTISKIKTNIAYLKTNPSKFMAWTIMKNSDVVGYLATTKTNRQEREIRIFIGRLHQGQGFATMALKLLIREMKMKMKMKHMIRLVSYVKPDNIGSNRIHMKVGFKLEGLINKHGDLFNKYVYVIKSVKSAKRSKKIDQP